MRNRNLFAIRIAMRGACEVEPDKNDHLPRSILHFDLQQIDSTSTQIEQKLLALVEGLKRQGYGLPPVGKPIRSSFTRCFSIAIKASASACVRFISAIGAPRNDAFCVF